MSQHYAAVLVFRSGQWTGADVLQVLAPVLAPGTAGADTTTVLSGLWHWREEPATGFCAAVWRPSANAVHRRDDAGMAVVDACLESALAKLAPIFEYFSIFEAHAERAWLLRVFAQLAAQDWEALLAPAYERILLPPHLGERYLDHPNWQVLADEEAGVLVRTRGL